ncbi:MAG: hypothetical protein AB7R55_03985 [Gemmatimonadales bacterium]
MTKLAQRAAALAVAILLAGCSQDSLTEPESGTTPPLADFERGGDPYRWTKLADAPEALADLGGPGIGYSAYSEGSRYVYAMAGTDYIEGQLYRFDLKADRWERLRAEAWPIGKYRKLLHDPINRRLITYWDGLGQIYWIPETGGAWRALGSQPNSDSYYEAYPFWNPVEQRPFVFAGYGFGTFKNLLWRGLGDGWLVVPTQGTAPDVRFGGRSVAVDVAHGRVFFAEQRRGAAGNSDDLWQLSLEAYAWTNLIPLATGAHQRVSSGLGYISRFDQLLRVGGHDPSDPTVVYTDVLAYDLERPGSDYFVVPTAGTPPPARTEPGVFYDPARRRVIVVSGSCCNDVWALSYPRKARDR